MKQVYIDAAYSKPPFKVQLFRGKTQTKVLMIFCQGRKKSPGIGWSYEIT